MTGARDQVGRLLALVPYIQTRKEVSVEEAAREFGVQPAQIVKDLNVLWFCGLPGLGMGDLIDVDMDAVEGEGVIRVSNADYLSRPLRLDSSEAAALIVALLSALFSILYTVAHYSLWAVMLCHGLYDTVAFVRFATGKSKYSRQPPD